MSLDYTSPAAFAQALRLRLAATGEDIPFVLVEGISDRRAFGRILDGRARIVPARGKEMLLLSREHLDADELGRCTIVIDCDGQVEPGWLDGIVIVSGARDLEADLVIELGVIASVVQEFLSPRYESSVEVAVRATRIREYVLAFSAQIGIVLDAARALGMRTRVVDAVSGQKRRFRIFDVPPLAYRATHESMPTVEEITEEAGFVLGWDAAHRAALLAATSSGGMKMCRLHAAPRCQSCVERRFSNGHDIVDALSALLSREVRFDVTPAEIARAMRLSVNLDSSSRWSVAQRLRRRQELTGLRLLA